MVAPAVAKTVEEFGFTDLTLRVVVAKPQFLVLEPITLTIVLENRTPAPIRTHKGLCLNCERLKLYRGRVGEGRTKIPELSGSSVLRSLPENILDPGEVFEERVLFDIDLYKNFPKPGPYTLHAVLWDRKKQTSIESKPVTLVIREPQGINRLALKHLENLYDGKAEKYWIWGTIEQHEDFLPLFRDSIYAPYVADYLAVFYDHRNDDKVIEQGNFMANRKDYSWADKALSDLFDVHQRRKDRKQEDRIVERLKQEHPNSVYTKPFVDDETYIPKLLKRFEREKQERERQENLGGN